MQAVVEQQFINQQERSLSKRPSICGAATVLTAFKPGNAMASVQ